RLLRCRRRGVGAAVGVLEAVLGLGLVGTLVVLVEDAVAVVVRVGAAVGVLEAVLVLRLVGALVLGVGNAVAVGVLGRCRRWRRGRRGGGRVSSARRCREPARGLPRAPRARADPPPAGAGSTRL